MSRDRKDGEASGGSLQMPRAERAYPAGPALRESRAAATRGPHGLRSPWGGSNGSVPEKSGPAATAAAGPWASTAWLRRHQPAWERLRALTERAAAHGPRALSRGELREFGPLYRQAAADLARLRQDATAVSYAQPLNALLLRAHGLIHAGRPVQARDPWRFYRSTYPRVFRACWGCTLLAAAVFAAAALAGAATAWRDPGFANQLLSPAMLATIHRHEMWTTSILTIKPLASSGIMTNNLGIAFAAFALGMTAGLGTLFLLFFNGLLLGTVASACAAAGMSLPLWSFVAPHGVLELPAIMIAGGAGLRLAQGLLFPGELPRRRALTHAGTEGVQLLLGTIPLLVVAGLVEGFISPTPIPVAAKFALAAGLGCGLWVFLSGCGRGRRPVRAGD